MALVYYFFLSLILYLAASCAMQSLVPRKSISAISLDFLCSEDGCFLETAKLNIWKGCPVLYENYGESNHGMSFHCNLNLKFL